MKNPFLLRSGLGISGLQHIPIWLDCRFQLHTLTSLDKSGEGSRMAMTILSSGKVERSFAKNQIASWEKGKYLILLVVLGGFPAPFNLLTPIYSRPPLIVEGVKIAFELASLLIVVYGIKSCFKVNEAIDHERFIERFVVLSVPISVKILIVSFPIYLAIVWLMSVLLRENHPDLFQFAPVVVYITGLSIYYIYFFFLRRSFTRFGELIKQKEGGPAFK
jgi:hypothetical protein